MALLIIVICLLLKLCTSCAKTSWQLLSQSRYLPAVKLASIDFNSLVMLDKSAVLASVTALTTIGALQIDGIPNFRKLREDALGPLHSCMASKETSTEVVMNDGARRRTIAIGSLHGVAELWDSKSCGGEGKSLLRAMVDVSVRQLFHALDLSTKRKLNKSMSSVKHSDIEVRRSNNNNNNNDNHGGGGDANYNANDDSARSFVMEPHESFLNIFDNGEHLEHFHTYYPSANANVLDKPTMDFHTDSGLLIAMTAGYYHEPSSSNSTKYNDMRNTRGLYIELPTGDRAKVSTDDDSLIIMIGLGGQEWLDSANLIGRPLRAVPHALISGLEVASALSGEAIGSAGAFDAISSSRSSSSRSWYGKMYQPPHNAIILNSNSSKSNHLTYGAFRSLEISSFISRRASFSLNDNHNSSSSSSSSSVNIPVACGSSYDYSGVTAGTRPSSPLQHLSSNSAKLTSNDLCVTSSGKVGLFCWMQCESVESLSCGHDAFCYDTVADEVVAGDITCPSGAANCKLECVPPPSDTTSFSGYCFGRGVSMIMAGFTSISYEESGSTQCLNILFPEWTLDSRVKYGFACFGVFLMGILIQFISKYRSDRVKEMSKPSMQENILAIVLFGLQLTLSYFAMLVAMTYSVELFIMVILGLTAGFGIFNIKRPSAAESVEPCCNYTQHGNYAEVDQGDFQEIALVDRSKFGKIED